MKKLLAALAGLSLSVAVSAQTPSRASLATTAVPRVSFAASAAATAVTSGPAAEALSRGLLAPFLTPAAAPAPASPAAPLAVGGLAPSAEPSASRGEKALARVAGEFAGLPSREAQSLEGPGAVPFAAPRVSAARSAPRTASRLKRGTTAAAAAGLAVASYATPLFAQAAKAPSDPLASLFSPLEIAMIVGVDALAAGVISWAWRDSKKPPLPDKPESEWEQAAGVLAGVLMLLGVAALAMSSLTHASLLPFGP